VFWILHGDDEFRRSEFLTKLKAELGDANIQDINTTVLDGRRTTLAQIIHACNAVPFMGSKRLVVVEGLLTHLNAAPKSQAKKKSQEADNHGLPESTAHKPSLLRELAQYLATLPDTTILAFVEPQTIAPNHPLRALCQGPAPKGQAREFRSFSASGKEGPAQLAEWIKERATNKGVELSTDALKLLAQYVGYDLRLLDQELDKLSVYVAGSGKVSASEIRQLVTYVREADIFDLVDALGRNNVREAVILMHRMLDEGKAPLYLLTMIVRQFRIMIQVKELSALGFGATEISRRLGLHEFVVQKGMAQSRNFTFEQLGGIYDSLAECDAAIKTGRIGDSLALDLLVAEMGTCGHSKS
jgi:DNA polymerase-3 subunit delta